MLASYMTHRALKQTCVSGLLDGSGLGHEPGRQAMAEIYASARQRRSAGPAWLAAHRGGIAVPDPLEASQKGGFLTSLGGSREISSDKGYGLSVRVSILSV